MSIKPNDGFLVQGPKPADIKMYVGDSPYMEYKTKEEIPQSFRYEGMLVQETIAGVSRLWKLVVTSGGGSYFPITMTILTTLEELVELDGGNNLCFVADPVNGGTFIYDEDLALVNNSGTIINGWVRQYKGGVQLSWFGDTSLEQTWLNAASVNGNVEVEAGTYELTSEDEDLSPYNYYSFGAAVITGQSSIVMVNMLDVASAARSGDVYTQTDVDEFLSLKAPLESPTFTGTVNGITKAMVGLSSVDNTSDIAKPISTLQQAGLDLKASLVIPTSNPGAGILWNDGGALAIGT